LVIAGLLSRLAIKLRGKRREGFKRKQRFDTNAKGLGQLVIILEVVTFLVQLLLAFCFGFF
jgi:hypothetical protein